VISAKISFYSLNRGRFHPPFHHNLKMLRCCLSISDLIAYTFEYAHTDWTIYSATVNADCVTKFNELKLNKKIKYIIYKLSDDYKEIVVDEASEDGDWDAFREKLINATSKTKTVRVSRIRAKQARN
jgi:hypothetical protein